MAQTVEVAIPVDPLTAKQLADPKEREAMGRMIDDAIRARFAAELGQVIAEIKRDARAAGVTDAEIDAELDAYNAERRGTGHTG